MRDLDALAAAIRIYAYEPEDDEDDDGDLPEEVAEVIDDAFIAIDWRAEDDSIIASIAHEARATDNLSPEWIDGELWVDFNGQRKKIPLTNTAHDRYVAIASAAHLLAERYDVWVLEPSLGGDTHEIWVATKEESARLAADHADVVAAHLERLDIGLDYFNGIRVPYVDHEDHNPDFKAQAAAIDRAHAEAVGALRKLFERFAPLFNPIKKKH